MYVSEPLWPAWGRACRLWVLCLLLMAPHASAHPAPFSYLDVTVNDAGLSGRLVVHAIDVAHELSLPDPARLTEAVVVQAHLEAIVALMTSRVAIETDGRPVTWTIDAVQPVAGQDAIAIAWRCRTGEGTGHLAIGARLFPYDPSHQTFVTVYEGDAVVWQDVLGRGRDRTEHFTGTRQGRLAVFRRFIASGIHHIAIGPDHILFVVGLLLPGGRLRRLLAIVTAFTVGHSVTLALATLSIVDPPARVVEPLIALSIVFVGADNLWVGTRDRDVRAWVALVFGLVHGFGFASVLRDMGLPAGALGVSLFAFNLGVEVGQAAIVLVVASALNQVRRWRPGLAARVAQAGSALVLVAGAWWFVERVFLAPV
jgi:hydrogenase/urease accessory protein HupE